MISNEGETAQEGCGHSLPKTSMVSQDLDLALSFESFSFNETIWSYFRVWVV